MPPPCASGSRSAATRHSPNTASHVNQDPDEDPNQNRDQGQVDDGWPGDVKDGANQDEPWFRFTENSNQCRQVSLVCDNTRQTGIFQLPIEVLLHIFAYFDKPCNPHPARTYWKEFVERQGDEDCRQTIKSARLVCHTFNRLASPLLFPSIEIDISQASLDFMDRLSRRPLIAQGVRKMRLYLYYRPPSIAENIWAFWEDRERLVTSLGDKCASLDRLGERYDGPYTDDKVDEAVARYAEILKAWDAYFDDANYDVMPEKLFTYQQSLLDGYEDYRELHNEQLRLITDRTFVTNLATSLGRLPNLRSLTCTDSTDEYPQPWNADPTVIFSSAESLRRYMTVPYLWTQVEYMLDELVPAQVLSGLLVAIHQAGVSLQDLSIECLPINQDFHLLLPIKQHELSPAWDDLSAACQTLTEVSIMPCDTTDATGRNEPMSPDQLGLLNSFISAVLSGPNLTTVDCSMFGLASKKLSSNPKEYYPLGSVVHHADWRRLERLGIFYVSLDQNDLELLCSGLAPSVTRLFLDDINLTRGVWSGVLDMLRDKVAAKCNQGNCKVGLRGLTGGEFERNEIRSVDVNRPPWLLQKGWRCHPSDSLVSMLVSMYVSGEGVMENPLEGDLMQILLNGPQIHG